ncbi:MAG TPA: 4'-phosphopantetheinyl transferase superfamily protein [Bryobacteraceae bacterium]|nr:4'-phosphopantetheinyl transferase superfamily protein [Bryobacteraceae bacterium]
MKIEMSGCEPAAAPMLPLEAELFPRLTDSERARANRFRFHRDRLAFVFGRALVRSTLSRNAPTPSGGWIFETNTYGKPAAFAPSRTEALRFNISHSSGLLAAAFARGRHVGIDIEPLNREAHLHIARDAFAPAEISFLNSLPTDRRSAAFFHLWTLKEAYVKARGMGLSIPLTAFAFSFDPTSIWFDPMQPETVGQDPDRWFFHQEIVREQVLAVAADCEPNEQLRVSISETFAEELL